MTRRAQRYYSEQDALAMLLLADQGRRHEVLFPGFFTSLDTELAALVERFWSYVAVPGLEALPANGFWLRVRG